MENDTESELEGDEVVLQSNPISNMEPPMQQLPASAIHMGVVGGRVVGGRVKKRPNILLGTSGSQPAAAAATSTPYLSQHKPTVVRSMPTQIYHADSGVHQVDGAAGRRPDGQGTCARTFTSTVQAQRRKNNDATSALVSAIFKPLLQWVPRMSWMGMLVFVCTSLWKSSCM